MQKCTVKTDPVLPKTGANDNNNFNPNSSDNPAYKYTFPGNKGFDLYTVGLGAGNMYIPSLYEGGIQNAIYGRCDNTEGMYVMAIVAGNATTKKPQTNFIVYFKSKPTKTRDFKFTSTLDSLSDSTAHLLVTDIATNQKTWRASKGVINYNVSNTASFTNVGGENIANLSEPLIYFSGIVNCQ